MPVDRRVLGEQLLAEPTGGDVPTRFAPVDEYGATPPTVRQRVPVVESTKQRPTTFELVVDRPVGLAHVLALEPRDLVSELAVGSDRVEGRQPVFARHLAVDLAESRRLMDEPGTVVGRDVFGEHDVTGVHTLGQRRVVERSFVVHALEVGALQRRRRLHALAKDRFHEVGRDDHTVDDGVGDRRVHGDRDIGQERPGRRRRDREVRGALEPAVRGGVRDAKSHERALVHLVGVHLGLAQFVTRQRRATARAVRDDLQILVQQSLVEELLEVPPHRLHVGGVKRVVRVLHVGPVADALGETLELPDVREDRFATESRELFDADLFDDRFLPRDPQLLLDLHLDGQAVRVPAGATRHVSTLHGLVTAEEVLVDPRPHVVKPRFPVRRGTESRRRPRDPPASTAPADPPISPN